MRRRMESGEASRLFRIRIGVADRIARAMHVAL
jgi:hypothetical protein